MHKQLFTSENLPERTTGKDGKSYPTTYAKELDPEPEPEPGSKTAACQAAQALTSLRIEI